MTEAIKARKVLVALAALLLLLGGGSGLARAAQDGQAAPANHAPTGPGSCSDGKDNDHDGEFDGADDDCREDGRNNEGDGDNDDAPNCSDGKDNDRDGDTDFPKDKGCKGPNDGSERSENRRNGDDDDDDDDNDQRPRATLTIEKTVRNAGGGDFDFEFLVECERQGRRNPVVREVEIEDVSNNETDSEQVRLRRGDRCTVTEQGDGNNRWRTTADGEQGSSTTIRLRNEDNRVRFVNTRRERRDNDRDLRIVKHLVDNTGATRDYTFTFDVTCGDRTETVTMRFQGERTRRTREVEDIRRGAQCTVTERDPGPGFTTQPASRTQTVTMNDDRRVEFTNTRTGSPPEPTADTATLRIEKVVENTNPGGHTFTYDVNCTNNTYDRQVQLTTVTPTATGGSSMSPTVVGQAEATVQEHDTCTVTEREADPANPDRRFDSRWETTHGEKYNEPQQPNAPRTGSNKAVITIADDENGDTSRLNTVTFTNRFRGGTTTTPQNFCGESDPREPPIALAQQLYDNLLAQLGILQDPERNGQLSGALDEALLAQLDPLGVEAACLISLLDSEPGAPPPA